MGITIHYTAYTRNESKVDRAIKDIRKCIEYVQNSEYKELLGMKELIEDIEVDYISKFYNVGISFIEDRTDKLERYKEAIRLRECDIDRVWYKYIRDRKIPIDKREVVYYLVTKKILKDKKLWEGLLSDNTYRYYVNDYCKGMLYLSNISKISFGIVDYKGFIVDFETTEPFEMIFVKFREPKDIFIDDNGEICFNYYKNRYIWYWNGFTKTQAINEEDLIKNSLVHVLICSLLRKVESYDFEYFNVIDEAGYYPTKDLKKLIGEQQYMKEFIGIVSGMLKGFLD